LFRVFSRFTPVQLFGDARERISDDSGSSIVLVREIHSSPTVLGMVCLNVYFFQLMDRFLVHKGASWVGRER